MTVTPTPLHRRRAANGVQLALIAAVVLLAIVAVLLARHAVLRSSAGSNHVQGSGIAATQTRDLKPFSSVELAGSNNVTIRVGARQSVVVHADDNLLGHVTTQVQAGNLAIGNATGNFTTRSPMSVEVSVPSLTGLTLSGSGVVVATGIKAPSLTVTLSGSGVVHVSGTATRLGVTLHGSGDAQLEQVIARDVRAVVSGSGRILVTATRSLAASVPGNGTIVYGGEPAHVTTSVTGSGAVTPAPARLDAAAPMRLAVYLVRGEHVVAVRRVVPHTTAVGRAALTALVRGPTAAERRAGYGSAIPAGTTLRTVSVSHGTATIDLGHRFEAGGGSLSMLLRVAQVVHTATQFPSVHEVVFLIGGKPVESIGGEGVIVAPKVGRANFENESPPILVEQPLPGDTVRSPIVVRGTANVFEARLVVEIVSARGIVLARKVLSASAGTGTRGNFETAVPLRPRTGGLRVVVYAPSPKDGSPIDVVRIPVVAVR